MVFAFKRLPVCLYVGKTMQFMYKSKERKKERKKNKKILYLTWMLT